ncbi:hypothetical protein [Streptomyces sp. NPDC002676]
MSFSNCAVCCTAPDLIRLRLENAQWVIARSRVDEMLALGSDNVAAPEASQDLPDGGEQQVRPDPPAGRGEAEVGGAGVAKVEALQCWWAFEVAYQAAGAHRVAEERPR